jgi:hypothetical protein
LDAAADTCGLEAEPATSNWENTVTAVPECLCQADIDMKVRTIVPEGNEWVQTVTAVDGRGAIAKEWEGQQLRPETQIELPIGTLCLIVSLISTGMTRREWQTLAILDTRGEWLEIDHSSKTNQVRAEMQSIYVNETRLHPGIDQNFRSLTHAVVHVRRDSAAYEHWKPKSHDAVSQSQQHRSRALTRSARYTEVMRNEFTAMVERDGPWYIAYCAEVPRANGQGRTREGMLAEPPGRDWPDS